MGFLGNLNKKVCLRNISFSTNVLISITNQIDQNLINTTRVKDPYLQELAYSCQESMLKDIRTAYTSSVNLKEIESSINHVLMDQKILTESAKNAVDNVLDSFRKTLQ
jgi:hypothetical protein